MDMEYDGDLFALVKPYITFSTTTIATSSTHFSSGFETLASSNFSLYPVEQSRQVLSLLNPLHLEAKSSIECNKDSHNAVSSTTSNSKKR
jgi:hypothetical protein